MKKIIAIDISFIALLILLSFCYSCKKTIDMNIPLKEKKIIINSIFNPDSVIKVNVSKSYTIVEDIGADRYINDATVKLYEDNVLKENLFCSSNKIFCFFLWFARYSK